MKLLWRGKVHEVRLSGKKVTVIPEGGTPRSGEVAASGIAIRDRGGVWVAAGGRNVYLEFPRPAAAGRRASDEIRSPMTGRVVAVDVKSGDTVKHGQVLAVVTAMKMEFRIEAPRDGEIEAVQCSKDELVDLGQVLIRLKP